MRQGTRGKFFTKGENSLTAWKLPCPPHHAAQNDAENVVQLLHEYDKVLVLLSVCSGLKEVA